jgi:hypothetical protein
MSDLNFGTEHYDILLYSLSIIVVGFYRPHLGLLFCEACPYTYDHNATNDTRGRTNNDCIFSP